MANCEAYVSVQNNTGYTAIIQIAHVFASNNPQQGGPWTAQNGQIVGPFTVNYETGNPGLDFWWVSVTIPAGPAAGTYVSEGSAAYPGKECYMTSEDNGQNLVFSVTTSTFNIQLKSSPCSTSLTHTPAPPQTTIQHVFVLMLENHSFDNMLGYSGITGNPVGGSNPAINGLQAGDFFNKYQGQTYPTTPDADDSMPYDPGHEFPDVLQQLCGQNATYKPNQYPAIDNSGFVLNYATTKSYQEGGATSNFGEIMKCFPAGELPALTALAQEFAVCDQWYASMPGPTWPNRFFAMAASSGGLDDSPSMVEMGEWMAWGFGFQNGNLFQAVAGKQNLSGWRLYAGSTPPIAAAMRGVSVLDALPLGQLALDLASGNYLPTFTLIEPNYGDDSSGTYKGGNSQHPMDSAAAGDALIQYVYQCIRNSNIWNNSLLIVVYDEHGGFYDHCVPPAAVPPGDANMNGAVNQHGFTFDQLGVRVPAVLVSPLIPKNTVDHTVYDHSSISSIMNYLFGTPFLTQRDKAANCPAKTLITLTTPRTDCPTALGMGQDVVEAVAPVRSANAAAAAPPAAASIMSANAPPAAAPPPAAPLTANPAEPLPTKGSQAGFLGVLLKTDLELSPAAEHPAILAQFKTIKTKGQAYQYKQKVMAKVAAARAAAPRPPASPAPAPAKPA